MIETIFIIVALIVGTVIVILSKIKQAKKITDVAKDSVGLFTGMDQHGLQEYAKKKGVKVSDLTPEEAMTFMSEDGKKFLNKLKK